MARALDLSPLNDLFAKGEDFELTDIQYENKIKKSLPQNVGYIKRKSPLAQKAKENGFIIAEVIEKPIVMRTVVFKKVKREKEK